MKASKPDDDIGFEIPNQSNALKHPCDDVQWVVSRRGNFSKWKRSMKKRRADEFMACKMEGFIFEVFCQL